MLGQLLTIARNTFLESVRQPIYFLLIVLAGILILLSTWGTGFSMGHTDTAEVSADDKLLFDIGLATVFVCGMLLAAFIATAVISREIENKTVLTVVSKPVPRPIVVLGKYLGVCASLLLAVSTMVVFLQLSLRHGVLTTAADDPDLPVIVFTLSAAALAFFAGGWGNFFYGWMFTQTVSLLLLPLMLGAWLLTMLVSPHWHWQHIGTDVKPQVMLACLAVILAQLVFASIATCASARLGQVMTVILCAGVFVFGLLSNHFIGRHAFQNEFVGRIQVAEPERRRYADFRTSGDVYELTLEAAPRVEIAPGTPFYYGPNPNGLGLAVPNVEQTPRNLDEHDEVFGPQAESGIVVVSVDDRDMTVMNVGRRGVQVLRPPSQDDYIFLTPTRVNPLALAAWGVVPNVQFFWLVDAVSQNQRIPPSHVLLVGLYAVAQIGVFLSLAVILFQTREVG